MQGHENEVYALTWIPGGTALVSGGLDRVIRVWDPDTGDLRAKLEGHVDGVTALGYLPASQRLVSAGLDRSVKTWESGAALLRPRRTGTLK